MNKRPIGVSILAVLHVTGGIVLAGVSILSIAKSEGDSQPADAFGISPALFLVSIAFLSVLALVSGFGMWRAARWGWWTGAFYYSFAVARAINDLFVVLCPGEIFESADGPSAADFRNWGFKFGSRALISALLLLYALLFLYLFKSNVLAYFVLAHLNKAKAVGILIAATLALAGLATGTAWFAR